MIIRGKSPVTGSFVKVVVDTERKILAAGCDLHFDCAEELISDGSKSEHLWGANIYPETNKIDFVSLMNIRPSAGNRTMEIQNPDIKASVEMVINNLLFS